MELLGLELGSIIDYGPAGTGLKVPLGKLLFDPAVGPLQAGLRTPTALYSPSYEDPDKTQAHRTYQTIQGLGGRLGVTIESPVPKGQEPALAEAILASSAEVVLICWEHDHIPALAHAIPTVKVNAIPDRVARRPIRRHLDLRPRSRHRRYVFGQVPQQLLEGDTDTVI